MKRDLRQRIVQFLEQHIGVTAAARTTVLQAALHDCAVIGYVGNLDQAPRIFTHHLVDALAAYGRCAGDAEQALIVLLRYVGSQRGLDVQVQADHLCEELLQAAADDAGQASESEAPTADAIPLPVLAAGQVIAGRYQLLQPIGDVSGQATVWQARDLTDPQVPPVAIKCLKPHPTRDFAARFLEEVRSVRELDEHPHIISIYDYGIDRGLHYLVMPLMRTSLRALLDQQGRLSADEAITYLTQVADALDFAHQHGIIHRDLKPANLLFTRETGRLCLADFGISYRAHRTQAVTGTGETAATEEYAAPEQLRATGIVSAKSDLYALAIIAYELLAGERPFKGSKSEIAAQHLHDAVPEHAQLPPFVLQVLRMATAKDVEQRPRSAADFVAMLRAALDGKAPAVIQHYLDEILPAHLLEVMPREVFTGLNKAFVNPAGEVRQQADHPTTEAEEIDWALFPPEVAEADEANSSLEIELGGELHQPRDGQYSHAVEYTGNVRERIQTLRRVVLLGEPGAGKTFMLGRLALDYAEKCRLDPDQRLPIFVPLSRYDTDEPLAAFVAARMGVLGARLTELNVIWLLDALNEMPREHGQERHLHAFINELVETDTPFVLTCRVKNYDEDLHAVPGLHRVDLQDLNPQQIYDILKHFLTERYANHIWNTVMWGSPDLLAAWANWEGSVRAFWEQPQGYSEWWDQDEQARARVYADPRKLLLLCRNPFTLVRLLVVRMGKAIRQCQRNLERLTEQLEAQLPNNRALLFGAVITDMLRAEAERQRWTEAEIDAVTTLLQATAAALQAQEQRTEMPLHDLLTSEAELAVGMTRLRQARDAGLIALNETSVRFNHQLFQEYFATQRLRDLFDAYNRRYPMWASGDPLPPRDERLAELFPQWWEPGGWRVTVALLGELEGKTGINRVVRWLASAVPEIALQMVLDNNDGLRVQDLSEPARAALIAGAHERTDEHNPVGRAAAYRVLGLMDADNRPGVGLRADGLPDIDWVPIPAGVFTMGHEAETDNPPRILTLDYDFQIARYPVTYAQFQAFIDDPEGYRNTERWFEGLAADDDGKQLRDQVFKCANHPRERVNWYQAVAFCRWLSWRLGGKYSLDAIDQWVVRLPTEFEWEKAARAHTGWQYPYGDKFNEVKGNTRETGIWYTSAVGIFPDGDTPHWSKPISDLSGNVWEWCLTDYGNPQARAVDENISSHTRRVLRGGSWLSSHDNARAVFRLNFDPFNRNNSYGFRLCRPPSRQP